ncbi:MAG TPA: alanine--tRNA ligase [Coxiellaceae bacterium]|nr:alanine--tRNA ligase [Coxiellaceae bacterium]
MSSNELRTKFTNYFKELGHQVVPSASLVPDNDPTLLFTNAGMVPFKDVFLGHEKRPYTRATSIQRCVRAGGKHNDLENVGYTARHHTFFEMMGNFSFGDYFKRDAIQFAWKFLTEVIGLSKEKLWVTVYQDDKEAEEIWLKEMKIDPLRFSRCSEKDNFWSMGETGPCGPCTEIFYDHGPKIPGGPPGTPEADGDRYIEIWNVVFMQYNRNAKGELTPLPRPSVDTGMGLERLAAVMQGVHDNYDIDTFQYLLKAIAAGAGIDPRRDHHRQFEETSMRVIADHIRSASFLILDGVIPSNEGRGYVLRRIIRRALRHMRKIARIQPFFHKLVKPLTEVMGDAYPELRERQKEINNILRQEEDQFERTLSKGMHLFEKSIENLESSLVPGELIFKLYDTYGFPADVTADMAREQGLRVEMEGFDKAMAEQRLRSKSESQFGPLIEVKKATQFVGYETLHSTSEILAIQKENLPTSHLLMGERAIVVMAETPFYAEGGGQIGDRGLLIGPVGRFRVLDTQKQGDVICHHGLLESGELTVGEVVKAQVDAERRAATACNHSATHLLHAALKEILGEGVEQKGSLVEPERLRLDFSYSKPITHQEIKEIENKVNQFIKEDPRVLMAEMPLEAALAKGAIALFKEKYQANVRVIEMGQVSVELCGGTHVKALRDIQAFKITAQSSVAAGIRRLEAVTGAYVSEWEQEQARKAQEEVAKQKAQEEQRNTLKQQQMAALAHVDQWLPTAQEINGNKLLVTKVNDCFTIEILRDLSEQLRQKLGRSCVVLASLDGEKMQCVVRISSELTNQITASEVIKQLTEPLGGRGGGRPDFAQGGAPTAAGLSEALQHTTNWLIARFKR